MPSDIIRVSDKIKLVIDKYKPAFNLYGWLIWHYGIYIYIYININ